MKKAAALIIAVFVFVFLAGCQDTKMKIMFDNYEKAGGRIDCLKSIAILDFSTGDCKYNDEIAALIAKRFKMLGYMSVMDSETAKKTLADKGMQITSITDEKQAKAVADVLGVDALVYGTARGKFCTEIRDRKYYVAPDEFFWADGYWYSRFGCYDFFGRPYRQPYLARYGSVNMSVCFFDAKICKQIGTIELENTYNKEYDENDFYCKEVDKGIMFYFDMSESMPMPSSRDMVLLITDRLTGTLLDGFTQYYVDKARKLETGVCGADQACSGNWDDAAKAWKDAISKNLADWRIYVDYGIYLERCGDAAGALENYKKAYQLNPQYQDLKCWIDQLTYVAALRCASTPICIDEQALKYTVADIKADGKIYINAGSEDGVQPGDVFRIYDARMEFDKYLKYPAGTRYYPAGDIIIEKTFEGVSCGRLVPEVTCELPQKGDYVIKR